MKKIVATALAALLATSLGSASAFAFGSPMEGEVMLTEENGGLEISDAGTYVLKGNLHGTLRVDPGAGDVTLVLDDVVIDAGDDAAIMALSGDSLKVSLPEGSASRIASSGANCNAAIESFVDTTFEGTGSLVVVGGEKPAVRADNANVTFDGGTYEVISQGDGFAVEGTEPGKLTVNDGTFLFRIGGSDVSPATTLVQNGGSFQHGESSSGDSYGSYVEAHPWTEAAVAPDAASGIWAASQPDGQQRGQTVNGMDVPEVREASDEAFRDGAPAEGADAPALPDGQAPEGQMTDGTQPPALPDGQTPDGQMTDGTQPPALPDGQTPDGTQPPALPDGVTPDGAQPPALPDGQAPEGTAFQPGMGMPGQQGIAGTTDSVGEIVTSEVVNAAADLVADLENAVNIVVTDDDAQVKISESGTYVVSGSASDGNIVVKKGTTGVVLVLDNLDLTSTTGATLSVNKEAEVKVIISGNVTLTDNENPEDENSTDEEVADAYDGAAIKAKDGSQVYLTGDGTLNVVGNAKNGIKAGDDSSLVIDGVTLNIAAANDGINGSYDVTVLSGTVTIEAGDDAIHADHILTIGEDGEAGPTVNIKSSTEGIEGTVVNIFSGDVSVKSSDDAINAANKDGVYEGELGYSINMTGGNVSITSGGDGMDSNGNINLVDGTATITSSTVGGEAGLDYDGNLYVGESFELGNNGGVSGSDAMPAQQGGMPNQQGQGQQNAMPSQQGGMPGQQSQDQQGGMPSQQGQGGMPGQQGQQGGMPSQQGGMPGQR